VEDELLKTLNLTSDRHKATGFSIPKLLKQCRQRNNRMYRQSLVPIIVTIRSILEGGSWRDNRIYRDVFLDRINKIYIDIIRAWRY
jgi:3-dehydroquinate dehydratase